MTDMWAHLPKTPTAKGACACSAQAVGGNAPPKIQRSVTAMRIAAEIVHMIICILDIRQHIVEWQMSTATCIV